MANQEQEDPRPVGTNEDAERPKINPSNTKAYVLSKMLFTKQMFFDQGNSLHNGVLQINKLDNGDEDAHLQAARSISTFLVGADAMIVRLLADMQPIPEKFIIEANRMVAKLEPMGTGATIAPDGKFSTNEDEHA